jgi:hypothetical protein
MTELPDIDALLARSGAGGKPKAAPDPEAGRPEPSRWFWLAVLGLAAILGFFSIREHWVPNKWLFGDGAFYMNVARGILENGSLRQEAMHPHSWYDKDLGWNGNIDAAWSNIALGRNGEWWPKHPILMPVCALPFVWAFGPIGTLIFQFLCYGLMAVFAYRVASRVASRPAALAAACAFVVTPWIYDRVWGFNNDVFYTVLILAAMDAALLKKPGLTGALLGIGIFAKNTNVLYAPALVAIFLLRKDWRGAVRLCIFAAVPATAYLGLNWYFYGSPFSTGYDRILVREGGKLGMHSHRADFSFQIPALKAALQRVIFGGEGFWGRFPLAFPAAFGLLVMALRKRWRESLLFTWAIAVPIVFHAPYTWYRLEFNLPQTALLVAPLAALLPPFAPPFAGSEAPSRLRASRLLPVLLVIVFLFGGLGRRVFSARHDYFWDHLPQASVWLGDIPCDYYNNQMERWECSHFDNDWLMTGRPLAPDITYEGKKEDVLLLHPHATGKERRLEYANVPMKKKLHLRYGLADGARGDVTVHFKVTVDDQVVLEEDVHERGKLIVRDVETPAFDGKLAKVILATTSPSPGADGCLFGVDGSPVP